MSEFVFILGAGASKDAGAPLMADFLNVAYRRMREGGLGEVDDDFKLVFKAIDALRPAYSHFKIDLSDNVESVFAAFEMAKLIGQLGLLSSAEIDRLPKAMRTVIEKVLFETIRYPISDKRIWPPTPYYDFTRLIIDIVGEMKRYEKVTLITFNYDLCLDYSLAFSNVPFRYCLEGEEPHGVKLLKLHGSLNWVPCSDCKKVVFWPLKNFFQNRHFSLDENSGPFKLDISKDLKGFRHCGNAVTDGPFIIPPTWNKTQHHQVIDHVWTAAGAELSDAVNIVVCGYSLPQTDHFFRYLLALGTVRMERLGNFLVFDPDERGDVQPRFEEILGPIVERRFRFDKAVFNGAIGMIRNLLSISS